MTEYIVAAARAPRGEPANNQFSALWKASHEAEKRPIQANIRDQLVARPLRSLRASCGMGPGSQLYFTDHWCVREPALRRSRSARTTVSDVRQQHRTREMRAARSMERLKQSRASRDDSGLHSFSEPQDLTRSCVTDPRSRTVRLGPPPARS